MSVEDVFKDVNIIPARPDFECINNSFADSPSDSIQNLNEQINNNKYLEEIARYIIEELGRDINILKLITENLNELIENKTLYFRIPPIFPISILEEYNNKILKPNKTYFVYEDKFFEKFFNLIHTDKYFTSGPCNQFYMFDKTIFKKYGFKIDHPAKYKIINKKGFNDFLNKNDNIKNLQNLNKDNIDYDNSSINFYDDNTTMEKEVEEWNKKSNIYSNKCLNFFESYLNSKENIIKILNDSNFIFDLCQNFLFEESSKN
ncbi:hypothetical protein PIROE2DRAFT_19196 [Piromyces sp. E2]|nr:hypothetical protein PIROE2DRAFT_19196 [Piromyces sp. E2]|eukprot:OUM56264.1 hypothetical protein PIROE2DRAFT_19196 [Piromyces sp. E2]